jgi:hypothetical protein
VEVTCIGEVTLKGKAICPCCKKEIDVELTGEAEIENDVDIEAQYNEGYC